MRIIAKTTLLSLFLTGITLAEVKLDRIFQSDMVLQRDQPIQIWGTASPEESIVGTLGDHKQKTKADKNGKWNITFPARPAQSKPLKLTVNNHSLENILIGDVWICSGQSNMVFTLGKVEGFKALETENSQLRISKHSNIPIISNKGYSEKQLKRCNTKDFWEVEWQISSAKTAPSISGVAWVFGNKLQKELNVPIGIIPIAIGGSALNNWLPEKVGRSHPATLSLYTQDWLTHPDINPRHQQRGRDAMRSVLDKNAPYLIGKTSHRWLCEPDFLFEAGISPLKNLGCKGVVWYQGEADALSTANVKRAKTLLPLMIKSWRVYFNKKDLPFLLAELPSYKAEAWPKFRELQNLTAKNDPHTYLSSNIDLGNENNIHPSDKIPVGERLATLALSSVYSLPNYQAPPSVKSHGVEKNKIRIHLTNIIPSKDKSQEIEGIGISTDGTTFAAATATFVGSQLLIKHPKANEIKKIRYLYSPCSKGKVNSFIYNKHGSPLGPFIVSIPSQTEEWKLLWSDEFNADRLDANKWTRIKKGKADWNNMMSLQPNLLEMKEGRLLLKGIVNPEYANDTSQTPYLTAGIDSKNKFDFTYGKVQIRARFQSAQGAWPALWMLKTGAKWGKPGMGEIDIMEHLNFYDKVYQTVHSHYTVNLDKTNTPKKSKTTAIQRDKWNTYGVIWDAEKITFTVNGKETHSYPKLPSKGDDQYPFNSPFYLILSMQIEGKWVGQPAAEDYPAWMEVDWVRVYQRNDEALKN